MILNDVTATISTRGRTTTTLPIVLSSLLNQNKKPGKLIVYDDNDTCEDPRANDTLNNILAALNLVGIQWFWIPGARTGQVTNHEHARKNAETPFIWRIDDDNMLLPDNLEVLYKTITSDPKIGAVGPSIVDPKNPLTSGLASNKMSDIFLGLNEQWNFRKDIKLKEVEHLQGSTLMYRVAAASAYENRLSRKGHREETIFTYEMFKAGWKLIAVLGLTTWHFHYQTGGIRSEKNDRMLQSDEMIFRTKLQEWKVVPTNYKFYFLDSGRGDHYAFKTILPEILNRYKDYKIVIGCCWPDCFWDIKNENVVLCSLADAAPFVDKDKHNAYKYMFERDWKKSVVEAYRKIYL
jgi:Glycosyl transferase family 2